MGYANDPLPSTPCCVCRLKRRGCDRNRPSCGGCKARGLEEDCSYKPSDMPPPMYGHIGILRQTVLTVKHPEIIANGVETPQSLDEPAGVDLNDEQVEVESVHSDQSFHTANFSTEPPEMASDYSRLRQLQRVVGERTGDIKAEEPLEDGAFCSPIMSPPGEDPSSAKGPTRRDFPVHLTQELADSLIHIYLTREYANLPIFDLAHFRSAYEAAKTGRETGSSTDTFHGILNVIFAISGWNSHQMDFADVDRFFAHGKNLAPGIVQPGNQWEHIQSSLLQSHYLYATGKLQSAWSVIGSTIRIAQTQGLHLKTGGRDVVERRDRDLARRLWHSAMIIERMLALQLGIPPQTPNPLRVPLPMHSDTDYLDAISEKQPRAHAERPSTIEFLTACARLYCHVEDIMAWEDESRVQTSGCASKKMLSLDFRLLFKVDSFLYDWQRSLPSFLRTETPNGNPEDPLVHRQRNILRIRYLYLKLRLHRPLLILGLALSHTHNPPTDSQSHAPDRNATSPDSPIALSMIRDSSSKCAGAAAELADLLYKNEDGLLNSQPDALGSNAITPYWENIHYAYACGIIALANRLCGPGSTDPARIDSQAMETTRSRAVDLLDRYRNIWPHGSLKRGAQRCWDTLMGLSKDVRRPAPEGNYWAYLLIRRRRLSQAL
ncbi:hypothetical protein P168DRAFT_278274 [Aspergillus campestris IBT 28561]|uniref:Zn(2)-C6 fungal-type domain-containing protein n=1 Tax=Aspergillus campestris (strain IBT 28561) TaxID=1392248 RepID=A0A2I1DFQ8_ASPC2|nr:uncharacterized protein P168DRAFT_278274 [Aspergillus campestris IBT 28561]PKY08712.1 hypothetical protein P168DRAFT_278274 [Aspergillus campestris IBT 28561]